MKKTLTTIGLILFLICSSGLSNQALAGSQNDWPADEILRIWLAVENGRNRSGPDLAADMQRFYEQRNFQPIWLGKNGLTPQGAALFNTLNRPWHSAPVGLKAYIDQVEHLLVDAMRAMPFNPSFALQPLLEAEVGMTQIALYFAAQLNPELGMAPGEIAIALAQALAGPSWDTLLSATFPRQKPYLALKKSLERYKTIALLGGWPTIPDGPKLRPGLKDLRVPLLRERLLISGDIGLDNHSIDHEFDEALARGVRRFQGRHGLKVDGVVGAKTLVALNIPVAERMDQIRDNLLPWYNMPDRLGPRYLMVNIPGFKLDVVENHHVVHSMRAIVGKKERHTPVMSAMMTYLEINPYWNIPQKIAREDILPQIHGDPQVLVRRNIQVFDSWQKNATPIDPLTIDWQRYSAAYFPFRLRQAPAAFNALGQVKFMFPNRFSVYIHDTPSKSLFNKTQRSFSSGCVRIEEPMALAEYLLAGQRWNRKKIKARIRGRKTKVVLLKEPIAVHLVYLTAWADEDGTVHFYKDLYERNPSMAAQLKVVHAKLPAFFTRTMADGLPPKRKPSTTAAKKAGKTGGAGTS